MQCDANKKKHKSIELSSTQYFSIDFPLNLTVLSFSHIYILKEKETLETKTKTFDDKVRRKLSSDMDGKNLYQIKILHTKNHKDPFCKEYVSRGKIDSYFIHSFSNFVEKLLSDRKNIYGIQQ